MMQAAAIFWAECRKLLSRPVARAGLLVAALVGALGPLAIVLLSGSSMQVQGEAVSFDRSAANGLEWALTIRHWAWATQILLAVLASVSYAGELQSHTLREDLVRPVERWLVLLAKWGALGAWSLLALVVQVLVGGLLGLVLLGPVGDAQWSHVLAGYAASWPVELSFAAFALCVAVLLRSVPGAVVTTVLIMVFERMFTLLSWMAQSFFFDKSMFFYTPFTPTSAWSVWTELLSGTTPNWQPWAALLVWTLIAVIISQVQFARTDVP